ncbi:MAG TPA: sensor domain-containing diguanylate cyclase [Plasticicumulans sp.]|nr:sensor domain-containing diguanylate cyclase [Plasticicumulans sp.]
MSQPMMSATSELPSNVVAEARLPAVLLAIVLGWAALIGALAYFTECDIAGDRAQTLETAAQRAETLLPLFGNSVQRALDDTRLLLSALELALESNGGDGAARDLLQRFGAPQDGMRQRISIADARGRLIASTADLPAASLSVADRDYFQRLAAPDAPGWILGKPVISHVTDDWTIPLAVRRVAADGRFTGALITAIDPQWLLTMAGSMDLGRTGTVGVVDFDGTVYLRRDIDLHHAGAASTIGTTNPRLIVLEPARTAPSGRFSGTSALDGLRRLGSYRVLPQYGLIVAYGLGEDEVLTQHMHRAGAERRLALLSGVLLTAIAGGLFLWRLRDWRQARQLLAAWRQAHTAARTDVLTGLGNRRGYEEHIGALLASRPPMPSSLLYIDCDDFKRINDSAGHEAGDAVLCALAASFSDSVRASDYVARLGGDEFVVLLANAGEVAAAAIAGKLKSRAETAVAAIGLPVTLSIGQITFRRVHDAAALTREVDAAMYSAKREGKNRIVRVTSIGT